MNHQTREAARTAAATVTTIGYAIREAGREGADATALHEALIEATATRNRLLVLLDIDPDSEWTTRDLT